MPTARLTSVPRRRRRALTAICAAALALAAAGCSDPTAATNSGPPVVVGEQVITTCFHNYFYNGVLPKVAAQQSCTSCVVDALHKLGVDRTPGQTVIDMLTGVRLSASQAKALQSACAATDASTQ